MIIYFTGSRDKVVFRLAILSANIQIKETRLNQIYAAKKAEMS